MVGLWFLFIYEIPGSKSATMDSDFNVCILIMDFRGRGAADPGILKNNVKAIKTDIVCIHFIAR